MIGKNLPISWKEGIIFSFIATSNIYHRNNLTHPNIKKS